MEQPTASGALSGLKVLDLSRVLAGPWASRFPDPQQAQRSLRGPLLGPELSVEENYCVVVALLLYSFCPPLPFWIMTFCQ